MFAQIGCGGDFEERETEGAQDTIAPPATSTDFADREVLDKVMPSRVSESDGWLVITVRDERKLGRSVSAARLALVDLSTLFWKFLEAEFVVFFSYSYGLQLEPQAPISVATESSCIFSRNGILYSVLMISGNETNWYTNFFPITFLMMFLS